MKKLAVIGGGAAGLAAAIAAGERAQEIGVPVEIVVFERDDRVGRSILATGNGRCNFSNARLEVDEYHNSVFVGEALRNLLFAFGRDASDRDYKLIRDNGGVVHAFFYKHGLLWREEDDGRQYPHTNKASTVVDILRVSAANVGVREECGREVVLVDAPRAEGKPFTLKMSDGALERADAVVVACGGRALSALEFAGMETESPGGVTYVEQRPMLGPLRVADRCLPIVRELDNIRVRCSVALVRGDGGEQNVVVEESGELLFRKYGVSGICVFNLSRYALPGDELHLNLLGGETFEGAKQFLFARRKLLSSQFGNMTCGDILRGLLLPRVAEAVLKQAGLKPKRQFTKAEVTPLAQALAAFCLEVAGIGDVDICQVRRGGLDVAGFDPRTMGARMMPGLYAVGEALDVDGPCGGYNLHWAWGSGLLAGRSAVDAL